MTTFRTPALFLALVVASSAHADTLLISSYATTTANPGVVNSATYYSPAASTVNNGSTTTYNLTPDGTWHPAFAGSSYVSYDPNTAPGGTVVAPNGDYVYTTYFTLTALQANIGIGSLSVLADDTVAVSLNNTLLLAAAGPKSASNTYTTCSDVGPNCLTPTTVSLTGLVAGLNVLTFDVKQVALFNEGLDYSGSIVAIVPEPNSLVLASTGLVGLGTLLRRRYNV